jgi:hypothetical protein
MKKETFDDDQSFLKKFNKKFLKRMVEELDCNKFNLTFIKRAVPYLIRKFLDSLK